MSEKTKCKYTELELRQRGVGKFFENRTHEWAAKLSTYHDEDVKRAFLAIKRSLALLCTDVEGHEYHELAHKAAQIMIDKFLLQRCKGQDVPVPGPVASATSRFLFVSWPEKPAFTGKLCAKSGTTVSRPAIIELVPSKKQRSGHTLTA